MAATLFFAVLAFVVLAVAVLVFVFLLHSPANRDSFQVDLRRQLF
jgi:hypothetical protein